MVYKLETPLVSVIMPVYNAENFIMEAVKSILCQTLTDLELIIVDDGSTDNSLKLIQSYSDCRIIIIRNEMNQGNYPARNKGLRLARGQYIAVMDADDVAHPERLAKQVDYLKKNKHVGVVGCWPLLSNGRVLKWPENHDLIKVLLLQCNCVPHSSIMMRKKDIEVFHFYYDENYRYSSDYDLMTRVVNNMKIHIIPEMLLVYRIRDGQISKINRSEQLSFANRVRMNYLKNIGISFNDNEERIHLSLLGKLQIPLKYKSAAYRNWIDKLLKFNLMSGFFDDDILKDYLNGLYYKLNNIV